MNIKLCKYNYLFQGINKKNQYLLRSIKIHAQYISNYSRLFVLKIIYVLEEEHIHQIILILILYVYVCVYNIRYSVISIFPYE